MLRITIIIGLMMVACAVAGCIGSPGGGGMGGQGISIHAEAGSTISGISIRITDGGTDAALRYKSDGNSPATTQPGI